MEPEKGKELVNDSKKGKEAEKKGEKDRSSK